MVKNLPANVGDTSSIPGLGRSLGEGNGIPLQYSYLGNPMDRGAWWATVYEVAKESDMTATKRLGEDLGDMSSLYHFRGYMVSMCLVTGGVDFEQFILGVPEGFSTTLLVFFSF